MRCFNREIFTWSEGGGNKFRSVFHTILSKGGHWGLDQDWYTSYWSPPKLDEGSILWNPELNITTSDSWGLYSSSVGLLNHRSSRKPRVKRSYVWNIDLPNRSRLPRHCIYWALIGARLVVSINRAIIALIQPLGEDVFISIWISKMSSGWIRFKEITTCNLDVDLRM